MSENYVKIKNLKSVRSGLGCITFSIIVSLVLLLVYVIFALVFKQEGQTFKTISNVLSIVSLVASVILIVGNIICLFSGEKYFTISLILTVISLIISIVAAFIKNDTVVTILNVVAFVVNAGSTLCTILALINVDKAIGKPSGFNSFLVGLCLLLYLGAIVLCIVACIKTDLLDTLTNIASWLLFAEKIAFFIAIFTTHNILVKSDKLDVDNIPVSKK